MLYLLTILLGYFDGKRRYYDTKNIELLKKVHFLLKEQGMTINGVKKILNNKEP